METQSLNGKVEYRQQDRTGDRHMESLYDDIVRFMQEYFPAYNQYCQIPETQHRMDTFYAPELSFDDGVVTSRGQWYERCLAHPAVQDKLILEHLFVDARQMEAGALLKTQAIDRKTGKVLVELKMNVLYNLIIGPSKDIKITKVGVFLESDPRKMEKLIQVYAISA
jgi:hypothetical protein